jgi:putative nucleotidyltransferase with HDIG domain
LKNNFLSHIESYVKSIMAEPGGDLMIAHGFSHVDRVRNWAKTIADGEGFADLELVEVTAILHDIGLTRISGQDRKEHGLLGAEMAAEYLRNNSDFDAEKIARVADAIRYHSLPPLTVMKHLSELGDSGRLMEIIRDADNLDGLGIIGVLRACTSHYYLPEYDPMNIKGSTWGLSSEGFREKFGFDSLRGRAPVNNIIDQINQQISNYVNLHTKTARNLGQPLVQYMKDFVLQIEREVDHR